MVSPRSPLLTFSMKTITLVGAGGKMGCRITDNLMKTDYRVHYLEVSVRGLENLRQRNLTVSAPTGAIPLSDVAILAVPDIAIGAISHDVVTLMKAGSLLMALDPAAPLDGQLAEKHGVGVVIAHPCHPSVFNWEPTENGFRDFYGGVSAKQAIVVALMRGTEDDYELGVEVSQAMYAPVSRVHRVTLEQMAMLEPALVETLAQTCMETVHEGYKRVVAAGVPEAAVRDFLLGHLRIQIAVLFN